MIIKCHNARRSCLSTILLLTSSETPCNGASHMSLSYLGKEKRATRTMPIPRDQQVSHALPRHASPLFASLLQPAYHPCQVAPRMKLVVDRGRLWKYLGVPFFRRPRQSLAPLIPSVACEDSTYTLGMHFIFSKAWLLGAA